MEFICNICHDIIKKEKVSLSCNHYFHSNCLTESLKYNKVCPYCRNSIKKYYFGDCITCQKSITMNYFYIQNQNIFGKSIQDQKINNLLIVLKNQHMVCQDCL